MVAQKTRPGGNGPTPVLEPDEIHQAAPSATMLEQQTRGEVDIQIATALRFPRSIEQFQQKALSMATLDEETAASCFYVLPRRKGSDKPIEGPSVRLSEIVASAWRHMRVAGRVVDEGDRFLTLYGLAWDLETNVARAVEVRRRITGRDGGRYGDDMIAVTANAGISIATRNAIFGVVPRAHWWPIYLACRQVAVGTVETLGARRVKMIEYFQRLGVEPPRVFALLEIRGIEDVTLEHLAVLKGLATAIKEGDTSIDEAFAPTGTVHSAVDPVDAALVTMGEHAAAIRVAFDALQMNRGQRLVQLRAFTGKGGELLQLLRDMVDAREQDAAIEKAEGGPAPAGASPASTTASRPTPAPTSTPKPTGKFSF